MRNSRLLLLLGVVFLLAVYFVVEQFLASAESPLERPDYVLELVRQTKVFIGDLVATVTHWLILGLGSFLLFLYLKIKHLERDIAELKENRDRVALGGCPPRAPTDPNVRDYTPSGGP